VRREARNLSRLAGRSHRLLGPVDRVAREHAPFGGPILERGEAKGELLLAAVAWPSEPWPT
jgi:hypothetical protein